MLKFVLVLKLEDVIDTIERQMNLYGRLYNRKWECNKIMM